MALCQHAFHGSALTEAEIIDSEAAISALHDPDSLDSATNEAQFAPKGMHPQHAREEEVAQVCPVCGGRGIVPVGFYDLGYPTSAGEAKTVPEPCRSCHGRGFLIISPT